jgi:FMN-dependent oxidoreductase (nitrilotriacetate monooxygenase family)
LTATSRERLLFGAFTGCGLPNHGPGLWWNPDTWRLDHNDVRVWIELVRRLEQARFDMLFLADSTGLPSRYRGRGAPAIEGGIGVPLNDPSVLISALGAATTHLGLTFTSATIQGHPFNLARKVSTLDHLTDGRVGWNIVTGYSASVAANFGFDELLDHDERYVQADEYLEVAYRLWEESWDDGAVIDDPGRRVYADSARVRSIDHVGPYYRVAGPHLCEPSAQRTPVLFQAGASPAGRAFAARHAEGVFLIAPDPAAAQEYIADVRRRAAAYGRRPEDLAFFQGLWFVVGNDEADARRRERELLSWASAEGLLVDLSAKLDVDLAGVNLDAPLADLDVPGVRGIVETLQRSGSGPGATLRDAVLRLLAARVVGTPERIAEELTAWREAGVDGINVMDIPSHSALWEFADRIAPVLQSRGLMQREYEPGTFREKLFGAGPGLPADHPARHRSGGSCLL